MSQFEPKTVLVLKSDIKRSRNRYSIVVFVVILLLGGLILSAVLIRNDKSSNFESADSSKAPICDISTAFRDISECSVTDFGCMCKRIQADYVVCQSSGSLDYQTALGSANDCCNNNAQNCGSQVLNFLAVIKATYAAEATPTLQPKPTSNPDPRTDSNQLSSTTLVAISVCILLISIFAGFAIYMLRRNTIRSATADLAENLYKPTSPVVVANSVTTFNDYPGRESQLYLSGSQVGSSSSQVQFQNGTTLTQIYQAPIAGQQLISHQSMNRIGYLGSYQNQTYHDQIYQDSVVQQNYQESSYYYHDQNYPDQTYQDSSYPDQTYQDSSYPDQIYQGSSHPDQIYQDSVVYSEYVHSDVNVKQNTLKVVNDEIK